MSKHGGGDRGDSDDDDDRESGEGGWLPLPFIRVRVASEGSKYYAKKGVVRDV